MNNNSYSLILKNQLAELETLKVAVQDVCQAAGLGNKDTFQVKLAVEEIFVNIVSYGYEDDEEHVIDVEIYIEDGFLVVSVIDDGLHFNPLLVEPPALDIPIEERRTGGLGIYLTKKFMDGLVYYRCEGKNRLIIKKAIQCQDA